jgi:hypothetical protein
MAPLEFQDQTGIGVETQELGKLMVNKAPVVYPLDILISCSKQVSGNTLGMVLVLL